MGDKTGIEWTDATWNPVVGCSIVSPGCTNCYAMGQAARIQRMAAAQNKSTHYTGTTKSVNGNGVWTGNVQQAPDHIWEQPLKWAKPRRIFVNSMGDLFHDSVPDAWIDRAFAIMALAPHHTFQILTKRAERLRRYMTAADQPLRIINLVQGKPAGAVAAGWLSGGKGCLPNVWLGVSAERQAEADERIPNLLASPAAVRFVSAEPLLGPIDFGNICPSDTQWNALTGVGYSCGSSEECRFTHAKLDLIIAGGESGADARPMHPDWLRKIRNDCQAAGVAFFFKQWGEWSDETDTPDINARPVAPDMIFTSAGKVLGAGDGMKGMVSSDWREAGGAWMRKVGKRRAGRLLDSQEHNELPGAQP